MPVNYPLLSLTRLRMEVDGDGVTTLVAGAGCPLACRWCINRDVLQRKPTWVTPENLYDQTKIDDLYFRATNGGLCFGGGEALLHTEFYAALRPLCPDWRLTAETSLNVPREAVIQAAQVMDAFIVDVKTVDPAIYRAYTSGELAPAWKNLAWLLQHFDPEKITVRVPLIPEYTDRDSQKATADAVRSLGAAHIDVFSYRKTGLPTAGDS